ncbi:glycosyl hydrolase family 32 [Kocuria rosea subsp. polaris]|uniref:beta-fructofuranosidase n=1 Tax=Kocuria rosea subsp. polaris TaxID=136273 RepID=A0A0W8I758_KOCRO|nr:glycosyl hydrolase family 32 [Kocuria polaris]KUG53865.1 glycosyl hydrolase family 32 [Kocuria polaris]
MFELPSSWVWDFWFADDGEQYHLFFLKASRALQDPDRRHWRASIGHATSDDLRQWQEHADAIVPADEPAFDDLATWTGSVVRDDTGLWHMFYTGVDRAGKGLVQRIGSATSPDLFTWTRSETVVEPDERHYEKLSQRAWPDEAWRDPWISRSPDGHGWHMLVTARAKAGNPDQRGVVGHAFSPDLASWEVLPPLSAPDSGFGQLEVLQTATVDGRDVLLFSCLGTELSTERKTRAERGGIWAVNAPGPLGPFDISSAYLVADESLYVGRLVQDRQGRWQMLAFENTDDSGTFVGRITDPLQVTWEAGKLTATGAHHPPAGDRRYVDVA